MDIGKVLEKAFKYPFKNKALWFYGVLIAIFTCGTGFSYTPDENELTQLSNYLNSFNINSGTSMAIIGLLVVLALVFGALAIIVNAWSQAAIIGGVNQLELGKKINRKLISKTGKRTVWNLIVLTVFLPIAIILGLLLLLIMIIALVAALPDLAGVTVGIIMGLLSICLLVPVAIYFGVIWALAPCVIVLEKKKAIESLRLVKNKIKGNFWITLLFLIIISAINVMMMFIFSLPLFVFGGLALYFWSGAMIASLVFGFITFIYLIFMILVAGYFQTVLQSGWTVWWLNLNKLKEKNGK